MLNEDFLKLLRTEVLEIVKNRVDSSSLKESLGISKKSDFSIVTLVDQEVSDLVHKKFSHLINEGSYHFYSEEDQQSFGFPSIILDPIDGTRELAMGLGECVVSLAVMETPSSGFAWLFNPFTGFEISSLSPYVNPVTFNTEKLFGYVSKGDKKRGLLDHVFASDELVISAKGSIAFKLGLLASGACDFVYSKTPKNIWDIAAGTLLCWERGMKLYQEGNEIVALEEVKISGELIWCREKDIYFLTNSLVKK
ncbi:inositol monophosphatase family protein [Halobacteriovorax sp. JY17]|uniref:inositol monophosphatase family protein n=1 Tax=Halobacteriovorax sp. JY17 TaxID=2014617 RepID=UPI000C422FE2|nr:inositol monophosphatase family protein [Halobacteriovorax sp. JY17]PIK14451.1 MAG: hypothetical protein CES88_08900 [Halobacteriovorax sp. JY17]